MEACSPLVEIRTAPNGDYKVCECGFQNAEFIVRACNAHDDLLRACQDAVAFIELVQARDDELCTTADDLLIEIGRAINKAKEQQGA